MIGRFEIVQADNGFIVSWKEPINETQSKVHLQLCANYSDAVAFGASLLGLQSSSDDCMTYQKYLQHIADKKEKQ